MRVQWLVMIVLLLIMAALTGCSGSDNGAKPTLAPSDSDSNISFDGEKPTDTNTYLITGVVVDMRSIRTGQETTSNTEIDLLGPFEGAFWPIFGIDSSLQTSGSSVETGKGFIRFDVTASEAIAEAPVGSQIILKTTDSKSFLLVPGDIVTFKCRRDFEPVAAVNVGEKVSEAKHGTWELDYCRLLTPIVERATE